MKIPCLRLAVLILGFVAAALRAEETAGKAECLKMSAFFAPPDSPEYRKYAPDRAIAVANLAIDVTPDFTNRTIAAKTTVTFKPIAQPLPELALDAVDLRVDSVKSSEAILDYQVANDQIKLTFAQAIPAGKEAWVAVEYRAEPINGIYFRTPEMGYKPGDTHLFSQGEQTEARHWYPCPDAPNQKFTSQITCRVPEGMIVISNGRKVSETKDATTGLVAVEWRQEKPHANYLISLCAGYFKKVEDRHRDIPLAFYTPPSDINEAQNSFRDTKDMMAFFEEEIGVLYPWPKYDQVVVNDFVAGGMENTSATTLTDTTLFTDATENIRSSEGLVSHELAHQWFGDYVTCKDWSHIWLNEGAATYYSQLYAGHKHGRDTMRYSLYGTARTILGRTNAPRPIVERRYDDPGELFSYLAYDKGAWVLHMLRAQLGEELYRRSIKTYLERHALGSVVTEDLNQVIEELSGRSFDQFFDQWVYHGGQPELEAAYTWDARDKLAKVSLKQNQRIGDDVFLFTFPLTVRFKTKTGTVDKTVPVKQKAEDFYFAFQEAPVSVRIDPEYTLLARVKFDPPAAMIDLQLEEEADVIGRLLAIESLSNRRDKESVAKLKRTLNHDSFHGVRVEAAKALRTVHTDDALEALLASTNQSDARVRAQVMAEVGKFYHEKVFGGAIGSLGGEKNPEIQAEAIEALGAYAKPEVRDTLLRFLNSTSYRNSLANAAIRAMRTAHDPAYIEPLLKNLKEQAAAYTSRGFANALDALASLSHDRDDRLDSAREFLLGYVNHPRRTIRIGAINALGTLEDPRAVPVLEKYNVALRGSPEQSAAANALRRIAATRRAVEGLGDLRSTVLDLQKANSELRRDLKTLEKKLDALTPRSEPQKKRLPAVKSPKDKSG
jgi:aminopeptidase N